MHRFSIAPLLLILLASAALIAPARAAGPAENFTVANGLYEQEEYEKARQAYEAMLTQLLSKEVLFNLGNTNFRLGKVGEACLAYRRAELLDPGMSEATQNLRLLQRKLGYLQFDNSGMERAVGRLNASQWVTLICAGVWLTVLGMLTLVLYRPRQPWNGVLLASAVCGGILVVLASAGLWILRGGNDPAKIFIVTRPDIAATTGPFPGAKPVIGLPPGTEVKVVAQRDRWSFVHIPGARAGWIDSDAIQPLWPYPAPP
jgi:hypothetical protein